MNQKREPDHIRMNTIATLFTFRARQQRGSQSRQRAPSGGEDLLGRGIGRAHRSDSADGRSEQGRVHRLPRVYSGAAKGTTETLTEKEIHREKEEGES